MFADDIKLFRSYVVDVDGMFLQIELINFVDWCLKNCLSLNIDKCSLMSFFKRTPHLLSECSLNGEQIGKFI